ncbi:unnamed protein product [Boreogadus saida]
MGARGISAVRPKRWERAGSISRGGRRGGSARVSSADDRRGGSARVTLRTETDAGGSARSLYAGPTKVGAAGLSEAKTVWRARSLSAGDRRRWASARSLRRRPTVGALGSLRRRPTRWERSGLSAGDRRGGSARVSPPATDAVGARGSLRRRPTRWERAGLSAGARRPTRWERAGLSAGDRRGGSARVSPPATDAVGALGSLRRRPTRWERSGLSAGDRLRCGSCSGHLRSDRRGGTRAGLSPAPTAVGALLVSPTADRRVAGSARVLPPAPATDAVLITQSHLIKGFSPQPCGRFEVHLQSARNTAVITPPSRPVKRPA